MGSILQVHCTQHAKRLLLSLCSINDSTSMHFQGSESERYKYVLEIFPESVIRLFLSRFFTCGCVPHVYRYADASSPRSEMGNYVTSFGDWDLAFVPLGVRLCRRLAVVVALFDISSRECSPSARNTLSISIPPLLILSAADSSRTTNAATPTDKLHIGPSFIHKSENSVGRD